MRYEGPVIGCDVHHRSRSEAELVEYLPAKWREFVRTGSIRLEPPALHYPFLCGTNKRMDAIGENGEPPGSSYELMREQLLDRLPVERAILGFDVGQESAGLPELSEC